MNKASLNLIRKGIKTIRVCYKANIVAVTNYGITNKAKNKTILLVLYIGNKLNDGKLTYC